MMAVGIVLFVIALLISQCMSEDQIKNRNAGVILGSFILISILLVVASLAKFLWSVMP